MIDLYTWGTPNGQKISIMLEEIGLPYTVHPIDISKGDQHTPEFRLINPNGKIPAIVDQEVPGGQSIFESGAVLVYLAEKTGQLLPTTLLEKAQTLAWVFWQVGGLGPMLGQWGHFSHSAPEKIPYAIKRYETESLRLLHVLDQQLNGREYLTGVYSIADIANYTWAARGFTSLTADHPDLHLVHLKGWLDRIGQRPQVIKGMQVPPSALLINR